MLAIVEDRDFLASEDRLSKFEKRHVWPAPRTINGEKAQTCGRKIVQMAVAVRHQLVAFLGCCIERERMVNVVMDGEGHNSVGTVDAGTTGIDQMLHAGVTTAFEDMGETDDVAVNIGERALEGVSCAGLGGKVHHPVRVMRGKTCLYPLAVGEIDAQVGVIGIIQVAS